MKIPLISAFLEDDVYETRLNDKFMQEVICNEDHFYHRIAKSISKFGFEPTVYYLSQEKKLEKFQHKFGHEVYRVPATKINLPYEPIVYSSKLLQIINNEYKICNFVSGYYIMYKIPDFFDYMVFKLNKKIPIIARWAGGNHEWLLPLRKNIKKMALQKCNKILVSSENEIEILRTHFQIDDEKIVKIINPIDLELFQRRNKKIAAEKISINPDFRYVLYVGRLVKNKGIEILLDCFRDLIDEYDDIKLIIIGDGPLLDYIKNFIKENHIEEKIITTGRLSHDKTCYYYNIATMTVNIGFSGGLANVIVESLASGTPVISTNVGASKEFVSEEKNNGLMIQPGNKEELVYSINKILNDERKFRSFDSNFLNKYSYENFGKKLSLIYEDLSK